VRRRTGGEREPVRVCVRTCSTGAAALFVQGFGAVRRQAGLALLIELAVFVCDVCDGCVTDLSALLGVQGQDCRADWAHRLHLPLLRMRGLKGTRWGCGDQWALCYANPLIVCWIGCVRGIYRCAAACWSSFRLAKQQLFRSDWPTVGMLAKASKTPFGVASHTHHYVSDIIGDNRPIGIPEQVRLDVT